ncbi:hypothetical protein OG426_05930 [Streptomyces canus]|uniref:hypothetical protein n=1 Tax=Streptomyces canus TaxID=58343 RepID=UPI00386F7767|nr:hypothetical protein OG426_05930 [Streptomyces canus]
MPSRITWSGPSGCAMPTGATVEAARKSPSVPKSSSWAFSSKTVQAWSAWAAVRDRAQPVDEQPRAISTTTR